MDAPATYVPPPGATIRERQNDIVALRLLLAQRRLHSQAKFWQEFRWLGVLVVGVAAPVLSVIWPSLAVAMGALAGAWLFLGRTLLAWRVGVLTTRAVAIQEAFDQYIFEMPSSVSRSSLPSVEDISTIVGPDADVPSSAESEGLLNWYPVEEANSGSVVVAIAQRSNAAYSDRLLRSMVAISTAAFVAWAIVLLSLSLVVGLSLETFLVGVVLPVLPAGLDAAEYLWSIRCAARDRADLARSIEDRLKGDEESPIRSQDLLVWQSSMYELRRTMPLVPDLLYRVTRKSNEAAMHSAAKQLGRRARGDK